MYCPYGYCLCRTVQDRSKKVWNTLQDAEKYGTPYHEDTVTQTLALHLNRHHPAENRVHVFRRATEGKNGSDFIWIFFDYGLKRHFPVAVQAKRLYRSGRYNAFKADQVNRIVRYARIAGAIPIYLTYNYGLTLNGRWSGWHPRKLAWPVWLFNYQRDLGLFYLHAGNLTNIGDGQLSPNDIAGKGRPMWTAFCTCLFSRTGDPLNNLQEALMAQLGDTEAPSVVVRETSPIIQSWKLGDDIPEQQLREQLHLHEMDDGFDPSFVLGTTLGNRE